METKNASPKRANRKRWAIAAVVVVAVFAVAGTGMWVWHEQPSFCGAICHSPMEQYLETYEQDAGVAGVDKWGNPVANTSSMLAVSHKAEDGATCLSCHEPTMSEQISEGVMWVSGNFADPMAERSIGDLTEAAGKSGDEFCLNAACHDITRDDLVELTADMTRNPHSPQHAEVACSTCHKAHRASVVYCSECHQDAEIPEGWLSVDEAQELTAAA